MGGGGEGRGARHGSAPPPETSSGSAPDRQTGTTATAYIINGRKITIITTKHTLLANFQNGADDVTDTALCHLKSRHRF